MAFENLYSNLDYSAKRDQSNIEQQQFAQMLGMAIQERQQEKDRDLKERQLKAKGDEFNLKRFGETALMKRNMGMPLNEREQAAITTMGQIAPPTYSTDAYGNTVMRPSGWASMGGQMPQGINPAAQTYDTQVNSLPMPSQPMPQGNAPLTVNDLQGFEGQIPPMDMGQLQGGTVPYNEPQAIVSDGVNPINDGIPTYQAPERFGAKGEIMNEESKQKLADTQAAELLKRNIKGAERFADTQLTAANFGNRMVESNKILEGLVSKDPTAQEGMTGKAGIAKRVLDVLPLGEFGSQLGDVAVHLGASEPQQQYMNAAENWLTANLRKESGAVIGADEMAKEYRKYFPMAGDSGALTEQKQMLRKQAEKGMIGQSAGAYQEVFGAKSQAIQPQNNGWGIKRK